MDFLRRAQEFVREVIAEFRKVTWPSRQELINSTVVAIPVIQQPIDPGTQTSSDIGVPLEPEEANQLAAAVSQTWPGRR